MFLNCAVACPESSMNAALESGWVWGVWRGPSSRSMGWGVTGKVKGSSGLGLMPPPDTLQGSRLR